MARGAIAWPWIVFPHPIQETANDLILCLSTLRQSDDDHAIHIAIHCTVQ